MLNFELVREYQLGPEKCWEYSCFFTFNKKIINFFTITDHFQLSHSEITREDILSVLRTLDQKMIEPQDYRLRDVFYHATKIKGRHYFLIFWFHNFETDHLWIRNCFLVRGDDPRLAGS